MSSMKLDLEVIEIEDIRFGDETIVEDGLLQINKNELEQVISDPLFAKLEVHLARPGESIRIIPVKDVIEPRIKPDGTSFPGLIGDYEGCGEGTTKVLRNCAVVTAGKIVGFQEGIIDMCGPGAEYSRYSELNNIVIVADPVPDLELAKHEEALRMAGIKAANYLASAALDLEEDYTEGLFLKELNEKQKNKLPRVAVMYMLMAQGLLHDNYLYGIDAKRLHTTFLHPNEICDGALVSGNCVVAGDKSTTYDHQNNALIKEMMEAHGKTIDFVGVILVPTYPGLADKKRCCNAAVNIARLLEVKGVILPEEGGGNPEADLMMLCRACEANDIGTVMMLGPDGVEEPVADTTEEADAVINLGDCNEWIRLPKMEKTIGCLEQVSKLSGGSESSLMDDGSMRVTLSTIMGSVIGQGYHKMTSFVY